MFSKVLCPRHVFQRIMSMIMFSFAIFLWYKSKLLLWFTHKQHCNLPVIFFFACWLHSLLWYLLFSRNCMNSMVWINTLKLRWNEQHFTDDIFKRIFFNENVWISIKISLKFVLKGPINNIPALVQIMAWRSSGDKPLSEPMMVSLPTHICITRPQWVFAKCPEMTIFLFL